MEDRLPHIIEGCKAQDRSAQKELYDRYAPILMSIALRYMKHHDRAEDVLMMGFYKIFNRIEGYTGSGSFEGWMKRIMINEALMEIRKKNNLHMAVDISDVEKSDDLTSALEDLQYEDLLKVVNTLPVGYRTVFTLYVIDGYKHREIAEQLGISINTSKSQLILAKNRLRELLKKKVNLSI